MAWIESGIFDMLDEKYKEQKQTIEEQKKTIEEQKKIIEKLEADNRAFKYFIEEVFHCHVQYVRVNNSDTYLKFRGEKGKEKSWSSLGAWYWECFIPQEDIFVEEEKKRR